MKVSTTTRKSVLFLALAGILAWVLCLVFHPVEPQYQGKKLTDWAKEIDQIDFFRPPDFQKHEPQSEQAIAAIRQIGTNALPVALKLCSAKDSWLKAQLETWVDRYNRGVCPNEPHFQIRISSAFEKHFEGVNIILALGPAAKSAIPDLLRLLQSRNRGIAEDVMLALPSAGTNAIPPLTELLNSANEDVRIRAAIVLGYFKSQGRAAIPMLLQCLENPRLNLVLRIRAIHALGEIKEGASEVVPVVVRHIQTENNSLLLPNYLSVLRDFGTNAKAAVPVLVDILESRPEAHYFMLKRAAFAALREVDPQASKPFVAEWRASLSNAPVEIRK
jgi:hypothetical protein